MRCFVYLLVGLVLFGCGSGGDSTQPAAIPEQDQIVDPVVEDPVIQDPVVQDPVVPTPTGPDSFLVKISSGDIGFYLQGSTAGTNRFLEYHIRHNIVPFSDSGIPVNHNLDSWNLYEVFEVEETDPLIYSRLHGGNPIVTAGSWECAILEKGAADFIGSQNHGDELVVETALLLDGQPVDTTVESLLYCDELRFIHKSVLYRCNSTTAVANYTREYVVTRYGVTIAQDISWLEPMELTDSYLVMLPIVRSTDDAIPEQITDVGWRGDGPLEDISQPWFDRIYTIGTMMAGAYGSSSGISASVEILETSGLAAPEFNFSNDAAYNKLYFDMSQNMQVEAGDQWHVVAKYQIDTSN